jgi:hypothetical protein
MKSIVLQIDSDGPRDFVEDSAPTKYAVPVDWFRGVGAPRDDSGRRSGLSFRPVRYRGVAVLVTTRDTARHGICGLLHREGASGMSASTDDASPAERHGDRSDPKPP